MVLSYTYHHSTLNTYRIINFWNIIILGVWKDIFRFQTFHFSKKIFSLSVSHEYMLILTKNGVFYGNFVGNRQTKNFLWKTDKVEMEVSHTFEISMGDKKKKSYGLLKFSAKGGGPRSHYEFGKIHSPFVLKSYIYQCNQLNTPP